MSVAFWSVKLSGGKPVEVQPPEGYVLNVQQAAITGEGHAVIKVKTVSVEGDKIDAVVATLRAKTTDQVNLSLVFGYDVPVSFVAEGKADVYLSGYYQPGPEEEGEDEDEENDFDNYDSEEDSEDDEDEEEEGSDDDDEEANIRNAEAAIAKLGAARKAIKNAPAEDSEDDSEDEDEDSEDDSEEEKIDSAFVAKMVAKHGLAGKAPKSSRVEELESEEDSEEEGSEEDSEEEEEAPPVKVQKTAAKGVVTPSGQKPKPTTPAHNNNNNKPKTPNGGNSNNNNNKTPNNNNQGGNKNNNSAHKSGDKRKR